MPRAAKKEDDEPMIVASNSKVKEFTKRLLACNEEIKEAQAARKDLMTEAKHAGISVRELKAAVRIIENPPAPEFKDAVNFVLETNGQLRFFA